MEALRHSLFAPSTTTVMMVYGIVNAMSCMIRDRYKCKDDNGKPLLPHPYEPWNSPTDPKYKEATDKAYRGFCHWEQLELEFLENSPKGWNKLSEGYAQLAEHWLEPAPVQSKTLSKTAFGQL